MSVNKILYPEVPFLWWRLFIPSLKTMAYDVDKQSDICRIYLLLQGLCVPSVKTGTYVCNSLIPLSVLETAKQTKLYQI